MNAVTSPGRMPVPLERVRALVEPGFNTNAGDFAPVHVVTDALTDLGATVTEVDAYGGVGTFLDWISVRKDSRQLALGARAWSRSHLVHSMPGPVFLLGIGHSNGANILGLSAELGAAYDLVVTINPAQPVRFVWPSSVKRVICFYSPSDRTVEVAKWSKFIWGIRRLAPKRWGAAGRYGYGIEDPRVSNIDLEELLGGEIKHSDFASPANRKAFCDYLVVWVKRELNPQTETPREGLTSPP